MHVRKIQIYLSEIDRKMLSSRLIQFYNFNYTQQLDSNQQVLPFRCRRPLIDVERKTNWKWTAEA